MGLKISLWESGEFLPVVGSRSEKVFFSGFMGLTIDSDPLCQSSMFTPMLANLSCK